MKIHWPYARIKISALALCIAFVFGGCSLNEPGRGEDENGDAVKFGVKVATRSVNWDSWTDPDTQTVYMDGIDSIRVIAASSELRTILYNKILHPEDFDTSSNGEGVYGSSSIELRPGLYDFFVIANDRSYSALLDAAVTMDDVLNMQISRVQAQGGGEGLFPAEQIIYEWQSFPFPRSVYMPKVQVGRYSDLTVPDQIRLPGASDWTNVLPFELDRLSARINLSIRKMTVTDAVLGTHENDRVFIRSLRILRIPYYAYMNPKAYDGGNFHSVMWYEWDGVAIEDNDYLTTNNSAGVPADGSFKNPNDTNQVYTRSNRRNVVIPEYILGGNDTEDWAVMLEIRYDYEKWNEGLDDWEDSFQNVYAVVPLVTYGTYANPESYEFRRNNDYHVLLTITQIADFNYQPQVEIVAYGWDEAVHGYHNAGNSNVSVTGGRWTRGVPNPSDDLYVDANDYVEYAFEFSRSGTADKAVVKWKAALSNPVDFKTVTAGSAVTGGYARPGETVRVRVMPAAASSSQHSTQLYINIDDGVGGVIRLPLNPVKTYTIYQNPT